MVGTWWAGELEDQGEGGGGVSEDRRRWGAETRKGGMYRLLVGGFIWVDVDSSRVIFGAFERRGILSLAGRREAPAPRLSFFSFSLFPPGSRLVPPESLRNASSRG